MINRISFTSENTDAMTFPADGDASTSLELTNQLLYTALTIVSNRCAMMNPCFFHPLLQIDIAISSLFFRKMRQELLGKYRPNNILIHSVHARQPSCAKPFQVQFLVKNVTDALSLQFCKFHATSYDYLTKWCHALFRNIQVWLPFSDVLHVDTITTTFKLVCPFLTGGNWKRRITICIYTPVMNFCRL